MFSRKRFARACSYALLYFGLTIGHFNCTFPEPSTPTPHNPRSSFDFNTGTNNWSRHSENPIVLPGQTMGKSGKISLNTADPSVLYDEEEQLWKMWFATAYDLKNEINNPANPRVSISFATSKDGVDWHVSAYNVFAPTEATGGKITDWDYTNAETPVVVLNPQSGSNPSRKYMLWYSGGNSISGAVNSGQPYYRIGLAFSSDGKSFTRLPESESPYNKPGLVFRSQESLLGQTPPQGVAADPHVVYKDGKFHMWSSNLAYSNAAGTTILTAGISYASSMDGIRWTPSSSNPLISLWRVLPGNDIHVGWQPSVIWNPNASKFEMWFTADTDAERNALPCPGDAAVGFFKGSSSDGINWQADFSQRDFQGNSSFAFESCNLITGVNVVLRDGSYRMYYSAYGAKDIPPVLQNAGYPVTWATNIAFKK